VPITSSLAIALYREHRFEVTLTFLTGTFPSWTNGRLYRNGPALYNINGRMSNHLFDGLALVQYFSVSSGKVIYRSQLLKTDARQKSSMAGKLVFDEFGTCGSPDPTKSILTR